MASLIPLLTSVALALIAGCLLQRSMTWRKRRAAALQYGCQDPPRYPHSDRFWGRDLMKLRAEAVKDGRQMQLYMENFHLLGKTWVEKSFNDKIINTMEQRNIQQVAALAFKDYGKPSRGVFAPFLGDGIFSQDSHKWKHSRDLVKPTFFRSELSDVESLGVHADRFIELIPRDGSTVDLQAPLHKFFLDASSEFLFGKSFDSQLPGDPNGSAEFLQAFSASLAGAGQRRLAGNLAPLYFAFDRTWKGAYDKVHAYVDIQVKRALEATTNEKNESDDELQTRYVLLHEMAKQIRDPIALRFQILNVFLPARDTTSILVANAIFHLARNPKIWTQLRADSLSLGDKSLTFETLKSLQLFKYVVNETLRLQGPAGRIQRVAIRDTILPVGGGADGKAPVFVEKGTIVASNTWGLHHDRDTWGEDVNDFNPERWVGRLSGWEFVPFFGGPRICPAQQQVLTQAVYLLVRLTREFFRIENRDPVLEYVEMVRMTTESRNGIKVALFP